MNFLQRLYQRRAVPSSVPVVNLVRNKDLTSVFQPVAQLNDGAVIGHQALVRAPKSYFNSDVPTLLDAAKVAGIQDEFELACVEQALECWGRRQCSGRLFVSMSAHGILEIEKKFGLGRLLDAINKHLVVSEQLVLELKEHSRCAQVAELIGVLEKMRSAGVQIALDGIKGSAANLSLWGKVAPDIVKLDSRFATGLSTNENQSHAVQHIVSVSRKLGCQVVGTGVERAEDLLKLRDLGVDFAQGIFLGSPDAVPIEVLNQRAKRALMPSGKATALSAQASRQMAFEGHRDYAVR